MRVMCVTELCIRSQVMLVYAYLWSTVHSNCCHALNSVFMKGVRRYGAHGTSYRYLTGRASQILGIPTEQLNLIVAHLGIRLTHCRCLGYLQRFPLIARKHTKYMTLSLASQSGVVFMVMKSGKHRIYRQHQLLWHWLTFPARARMWHVSHEQEMVYGHSVRDASISCRCW